MNNVRNQTTDKINQQKTEVPQSILYVVSKNVELEHVPAYVKNIGVKKQGREEGVKVFSLDYIGWNHGEIFVDPVCE
jgi:hypothetical protein